MIRAFVGTATASFMVLAGLESAPAVSDTVEPITVASLAGSWDRTSQVHSRLGSRRVLQVHDDLRAERRRLGDEAEPALQSRRS